MGEHRVHISGPLVTGGHRLLDLIPLASAISEVNTFPCRQLKVALVV